MNAWDYAAGLGPTWIGFAKTYVTGPYDYANPVTSGSEPSFGRGKV